MRKCKRSEILGFFLIVCFQVERRIVGIIALAT